MKSFKEMREAKMVASADFKVTASGRKVHKMKKVGDDNYTKEKDLDNDGDNDQHDKDLAKGVKESLEEAVTVNKHNYSWGKMVTVHHGSSTSYPLHPEHQAAIKKLKHGEKTSFKDETGAHVTAHREDDKVHLTHKGSSTKTTVAHSHFNESVEQVDEVLDMRHHTTGTGSIHVSHTHTSPSRVHSIGYTDAHKISNLKTGEKHEYKNANGHETFTAHKQADGSTKIHDNRGTHVATIKNKMGRYDGQVKESLDEAVDKQEQRFLQLARLGLVDKSDVSKLRLAVDQLKADKTLTVQQRGLLLGVMMDLVDLVTGDDAVFQRVKMDVQKEGTEGSWKVETPWMKSKDTVTDKSGAKHTPQSRVRHLARLALKKQQAKNQSK